MDVPGLTCQDSLRCPRRWADHSFYLFWVLSEAFVHRLRNKIWLWGWISEQLPLILPGSGQTGCKEPVWCENIIYSAVFGRGGGHWSSPFSPVMVALRWIIQQGEFSSGHSGSALTEGFRAGIILCGLKTEETFGSEMPLNWNLAFGNGQTAFFPSSGKDFYFFFHLLL